MKNMPKWVTIGLLAGILLGAFFSLWDAPVSLSDLLKQPLQSLWGSHQQLKTGVLEVSENIDSVEEATRRLLKPFGGVRLLRRFPSHNSENPTESSEPGPASKP